jgi:hypothetical protein
MPTLADLQGQFAAALRDPEQPPPSQARGPTETACGRRFDVHRNNMTVSLVEALESSYPAVRCLVGDEYFAAVARAFVRQHPPRSPVLLHYGGDFGDFLQQVPSATRVPYLGDVARLEWARIAALHAADAAPATLSALAEIAEQDLPDLSLRLHPTLTLIRTRWPVAALWQACCEPEEDVEVRMDEPQQVAILRPAWEVTTHCLPIGQAVFVIALQQGLRLADAAGEAAESDPSFDLAEVLQRVFAIGAIAAVERPPQQNRRNDG